MLHIVKLYKGRKLFIEKTFFTYEEADAYMAECEKLSAQWSVLYQRKPQ